ncbi:MAG TPA: energy transducer TonB [Candidatus Binatia bacterium]|nr:energy transducer TonB [Candidatus Binatia bacterium]
MNTHVIAENERAEQKPEQNFTRIVISPLPPAIREKALFEDILLESSGGQRRRRTWATLLSFLLEAVLLGVLVLIPLWFTDVLPKQQLLTFLEAPAPPPPPPPAAPAPTAVRVVKVTSDISNGQLRTPGRIPAKVQRTKEDDAPPPAVISGGVVGGVPGGIPGGQLGGVIGGIVSSASTVAAVPTLTKPTPQRVRVSQGVSKGLVIYRIEPTYPPAARAAHIQGVVVLAAIIDKDGNIQNLQVVSGHPMLVPAAIEAVKQWRYKPFLLNGQPLEVETAVTVTFQLRSA